MSQLDEEMVFEEVEEVEYDSDASTPLSSVLTSRTHSTHSFHHHYQHCECEAHVSPLSGFSSYSSLASPPVSTWEDAYPTAHEYDAETSSSTGNDGNDSAFDGIALQHSDSFKPAVATMSLGLAGVHSLVTKLEAAAEKGFQGIELFWDDLIAYATELAGRPTSTDWESEVAMAPVVEAATRIKMLSDELHLSIISLQPFRNYDGIVDQEAHDERIREFKFWLQVSQCLGCGAIGVPSTIGADPNGPKYTGDLNVLASDLRELAQLARPYGIRIAYENLCFGKHIRSWRQAWEVILRSGATDLVDFLPDTFNLCGDVYADPSSPKGYLLSGDARLKADLTQLTKTVPLRNLSFLQVADAEFMSPPITEDHPWMAGCTNPKMAWSRNARLFPYEAKGYLPVVSVVKALVAAGWSGWVSMEIFSRSTKVEGDLTILEHADRAWRSWESLAKEMKWSPRP